MENTLPIGTTAIQLLSWLQNDFLANQIEEHYYLAGYPVLHLTYECQIEPPDGNRIWICTLKAKDYNGQDLYRKSIGEKLDIKILADDFGVPNTIVRIRYVQERSLFVGKLLVDIGNRFPLGEGSSEITTSVSGKGYVPKWISSWDNPLQPEQQKDFTGSDELADLAPADEQIGVSENNLPPVEDPTDQRIMKIVTENLDITDLDIALKLGLSRQAVNNRRRALEKMGYEVR
jgi:hypothetical protein